MPTFLTEPVNENEFPLKHKTESETIIFYNEAIKLAGEVNDFATRLILEEILNDEDKHIDKIEEFQDQIQQMSIQMFLSMQTI